MLLNVSLPSTNTIADALVSSMRYFGFPRAWEPKDFVTLAASAAAVFATVVALLMQSRGEDLKGVITLPELVPLGMPNPDEQVLRAETRATRRADYAKGQLYVRVATLLFVAAIFFGLVASEPWLAISGIVVLLATICYAAVSVLREPRITKQRLKILAMFRQARSLSLGTNYMFNNDIYADIDKTFSAKASELPQLQRALHEEIELRKHRIEQYNARRAAGLPTTDIPGD